MRVNDVTRVDGKQRVAVSSGFRGEVGADRAAGAGPIVDDESLSERLLQLLSHHARETVRAAAGGEGYDDANRFTRVCLAQRVRGRAEPAACAHERAKGLANAHASVPISAGPRTVVRSMSRRWGSA